MNKRYILLFSFLTVIFFSISFVKTYTINFANFLKQNINNSVLSVDHTLYLYINQADKIKELKKENVILNKKISLYDSFFANCKDLKKFKFIKDSHLIFTKTISYAALPDFSKIYVDYYNQKYPEGLVYNNLAAGVLIKKIGHYSLGLLNSNSKTSYTVLIGKDKIPGIFYGGGYIIKYIPKFKKINIGDLVITSGLDGIFYKGAKVGIIKSIKNKKLYQEAKINVFYNNLNPGFFYVVKKNIQIKGITDGVSKH